MTAVTQAAIQHSYTGTQAVADKLIGKTEEEARALAGAAGLSVRIACKDGEYRLLTQDLRADRVSLHLERGIVTKVSCG